LTEVLERGLNQGGKELRGRVMSEEGSVIVPKGTRGGGETGRSGASFMILITNGKVTEGNRHHQAELAQQRVRKKKREMKYDTY